MKTSTVWETNFEYPYTLKKYEDILLQGIPARIFGKGGGYSDTVEFGADMTEKDVKNYINKGKIDMIVKNADIAARSGKRMTAGRRMTICINEII